MYKLFALDNNVLYQICCLLKLEKSIAFGSCSFDNEHKLPHTTFKIGQDFIVNTVNLCLTCETPHTEVECTNFKKISPFNFYEILKFLFGIGSSAN